jgi:hypothetical protein
MNPELLEEPLGHDPARPTLAGEVYGKPPRTDVVR